LTLAMLGREEEAMRQLRETMAAGNRDRQYRAYHEGLLGTLEGHREAALSALDTVVSHNRDPEALFYMMRSYARLGERDRALDLLERISRSFFPVTAFERDPWLDPLRDSPRFAEILRRATVLHNSARAVWETTNDER
jgi:pentatricopeptide repeat protein